MTDLSKISIKEYVAPLDDVQRCDDKKLLGSALTQVDSSHAAVFVYDQDEEFLGLVSPYKTIYSSNYPHTTLVSSIVFTPPQITETATVYEVAKHMIASKIYMLPVFTDQGAVGGVIYGKDIVQNVIKNKDSLAFIKEIVEPHDPITAPSSALVNDVFYKLKEIGVSRIVLVDDNGALDGIVTRGDLLDSVAKPTQKMRFPNEGTRIGHKSYAGEKKSRKEEPVRKFSTSGVFTLPDNTPLEQIVTQLSASTHNSVVLVNKQNVPTGFLSTRDILQAIALMRPKESVPIQIKHPSDAVETEEFERAIKHLEIFAAKLEKRLDVERIEVTTKEPKTQAGGTHQFDTTVKVIVTKGDPLVAQTDNRAYFDGIQSSTQIIEKQQRRSR